MKKTLYLLSLVLSFGAYAQSGIHTKAPKATLDVRAKNIDGSTAEGIIAPRLSGEALHQADVSGKYGAAHDGTLAFVTAPPAPQNRVGQTIDIDIRGYYYYDFPANKWIKTTFYNTDFPQIQSLDCAIAVLSNNKLYQNIPYTGTLQVPYTNGNGEPYSYSVFISNGLTFTLPAGTLAQSNGVLTYYVSGTPTTLGTVSVPLSFSSSTCSVDLNIAKPAVIEELNCSNSQLNPSYLVKDIPYTGIFSVGYINGNGGDYPASSFTSNGLTFSLPAGTLNNGSGTLQYTVTGTPTASGTIYIPVNFAGKMCISNFTVAAPKVFQLLCNANDLSSQTFIKGIPYTGTFTLPYSGGNEIEYPQSSFTVNGLTFTLQAGTLTNDTGVLEYTVTGTPINSGIFAIPFNFAEKSCSISINVLAATVGDIECSNAVFSPSQLYQAVQYSGTLTIPYSGGNGIAYATESFTTNGLTFTLQAGTLTQSTGAIVYSVTGTPTTFGAITIPVNFGGQSCNLNTTINAGLPTVDDITCASAVFIPATLTRTVAYTGTLKIPYTGGNGAPYPSDTFTQNGLTFSLPAGALANGSGNLEYTVTGTPTTSGDMQISYDFAGQSCTIQKTVAIPPAAITGLTCWSAVYSPNVKYTTQAYNGELSITYTGGNGGSYPSQSFVQNGFTYTLAAGVLNVGSGTLKFTVKNTATNSTATTVSNTITFLGKTCTTSISINKLPVINTLACEDFTSTSTTVSGQYSKLSPYPEYNKTITTPTTLEIKYKGGNNTPYPAGEPFTVGGLTFKLRAGTTAVHGNAIGSLIYDVTGKPTQLSIIVPIDFYGKTCAKPFYIGLQTNEVLAIKGRIWKKHNVGVISSLPAEPTVLTDDYLGNYYQWGRNKIVADKTTSSAAITGWDKTYAANGSWVDASRTTNDPCPTGFKVPSRFDFTDLLMKHTTYQNITNTQSSLKSWGVLTLSNGSNMKLILPRREGRVYTTGIGLGTDNVIYWTSSEVGTTAAYSFNVNPTNVSVAGTNRFRSYGALVRCISVP